MIDALKGVGTKVGVRPGGSSMNKKNSIFFFPYGGVFSFFLCGQSFLFTWGPFSPCAGSLSPYGVGAFLVLPPPPTIFLQEPLVTVFTAQIFIIFPDRGD